MVDSEVDERTLGNSNRHLLNGLNGSGQVDYPSKRSHRKRPDSPLASMWTIRTVFVLVT